MRALKTKTHGIDKRLGENLRMLRQRRGMTQDQLAAELGISFQQLQKYESGSNRIAASTMYFLSNILKASMMEFFRDVGEKDEHESFSREEIECLRLFKGLPPGKIRKDIIRMMKTLGDSDRAA